MPRAEEKKIAEDFCRWLGSRHLINFDRPAPWERIEKLFVEFALENGLLLSDCKIFKYRYPIRLICSDLPPITNAREIWNDYWNRATKPVDKKIAYCRNSLCGIGSRQIKIKLNSLQKTDLEAFILRQLLELEDVQLTSGKYFGDYWKRSIERGRSSLKALIEVGKLRPDLVYCGLTGFHGFRVAVYQASGHGQQFEWNIADFQFTLPIQRFALPLELYDEPQLYRLEKLIYRKLFPK